MRPHAGLAVRRLQERRDRGGRARPLRAGRRRLRLVPRRGRLQLPPRRRGRHGRNVAGRQGGPGGDDHARAAHVGQVIRPENIPGLVFEEVTVKETGRTVQGPRGPVAGAMVANELHQEGSREDKFFAPGYGEFRSAGGGDLEAMALAVPTDALTTPMPAELDRAPPRRARQAPRVRSDARDVARHPRRRAAATGAADDARACERATRSPSRTRRSTSSSSTGRLPRSTATGSRCGRDARGSTRGAPARRG